MRLLWLEIKRVLGTKITWILLGSALFLSAVMAYLPVTFEYCSVEDKAGGRRKLAGMEAVNYYRQYNDSVYGEVTPEIVGEAVEAYQNVYEEYDSVYGEHIPEEVYYDRLSVYMPYIKGVKEVMAHGDTGMAPAVREIGREECRRYYEKMTDRLTSIMNMEQKNHPSARAAAQEKFEKVRQPYMYYYGAGSNSMDYQTLFIFLITIFCTIIAAPVFSSDYQTGADDILRCTKHGKARLGAVKMISALIITAAAFLLCGVVWIAVTNCLFGWEGTRTSMQMIFSITALCDLTVGELMWVNMLGSFLLFLSGISFTLLLSSRMKSNVASLAAGLLFVLLPVIVYMALPGTMEQAGEWIGCLLPGGGIGLSNSLLYSLCDFKFLHLGAASVWNVEGLLIGAVVKIPVFVLGGVWSYCRGVR